MYYKTLKKKSSNTIRNDLPYVRIGIINVVQNAILLKVIHRFNVPVKALTAVLIETARNAEIHIQSNRPQIAKTIRNRRATPDLKLYTSHSTGKKRQMCTPIEYRRGPKNRRVHQWDTGEDPKVNLGN